MPSAKLFSVPDPVALIFHRLAQDDLDLLADEALELARLGELALDPGRTDFERVVRAGNHVFDIQNGAHVLRNEFAIGVRDALRLVDKNAQNPAPPPPSSWTSTISRPSLAPTRSAISCTFAVTSSRLIFCKPNKKVGFRPLPLLDSYL